MNRTLAKKNIVELDDRQWEEIVEKKGEPIVVMFYNQLCPFCALMMPHFEKYAEEFKEKITFARIDADKNPYSAEKYGIMSTPTFKFFCKGRHVQEIVGRVYPPSQESNRRIAPIRQGVRLKIDAYRLLCRIRIISTKIFMAWRLEPGV